MAVVLRSFTLVFSQAAPKRQPMMGTLAEIEEDITRLREMGVTELVHSPPSIGFGPPSMEEGISVMEQLIDISR